MNITNSVHQLKSAAANKAPREWYRIEAKGKARADIYVFGVIGGGWFEDGPTSDSFRKELKAIGNAEIDLHIDSEGGSVKQAQAMYSLLIAHPAKVVAHIDGWACSAASFLAMAAEEIRIGAGSMFMIHNARMMTFGTADDMESAAALLRTTNQQIAQKYADRSGRPMDKIKKWMDEETWFTGQQAKDEGFADIVVENRKIAASVSAVRDLSHFSNLPAALHPNRIRASAALAAMAKVMR